ncbi:NAD dependent epimerase dehydratase family protein [Seminavis robusta]|uniref:NAD dependent epimerase dehydratase family protein n=1 Tax=Seminavis robusta TaxID=568900 RepID=A0A9N8HNU6_9STRA|nr:NAD dependent epimerase dehydratase family protein [Seminavis robusta]|eukprot:Sro1025_g232830.1 NAD dependent epimerase dehydratase family protein (282) ;mRNA; f:37887-38861
MMINRLCFVLSLLVATNPAVLALAPSSRVVVFGGTGYVGSQVCERLVNKGYTVTAVSRRGTNPRPGTALDEVTWAKGDATDSKTISKFVSSNDAVVHAVGLLFDVDSGLQGLNNIVSGSKSQPGDSSTYDNITRKTMFNILDAAESPVNRMKKGGKKMPLAFVSCAEAGWPDVQFGEFVEEKLAPAWLQKYLIAKRAVEDRLSKSTAVRPVIVRPSLIWSWDKLDVLPIIPVFNIANALGVPFVDKTVRVETLADAIVTGLEDDTVEGVARYMKMEELAAR